MDLSDEYIKMCKDAEEIQEIWYTFSEKKDKFTKVLHGDYYTRKYPFIKTLTIRFQRDGESKEAYNRRLNQTPGVTFYKRGENEPVRIWRHDTTLYPMDYVWLPRQDQLQEIMKYKDPCLLNACIDLRDFSFDSYTGFKPAGTVFDTMEKLWLAMVMHKKFKKKWYDGFWFPSKEVESWKKSKVISA